MAGEKFDSKSFNPQAFGAYTERIPNLKKNELIKSRALKGNQDIKNTFSSQTGTVYAVLPMHGLIGGAAQNYDGETDLKSENTDTFERGVVVVGRMKGWTERDFSEDVTGGVSFMDNVAAQVNDYKADLDQTTLVKILDGVFAMTGNLSVTPVVYLKTYEYAQVQVPAICRRRSSFNIAVYLLLCAAIKSPQCRARRKK